MIRKTFIVDVGTKNEFVITLNSNDIKIVINDINEVLFNFAEFIKSNTAMLDSVIIMIDLSKVEDDLMLDKMLNRYLKEYCLNISIVSITKQIKEDRSSSYSCYEETLRALNEINEIVSGNPTVRFSDSSLGKVNEVEEVTKESVPVVPTDTETTSEKPKKKYKKYNRNNDPYYCQGELGYNWFHLKHSSISGPDNW